MDQDDIQIVEDSQKPILVSLKGDNMEIVPSLVVLMSTQPVLCSVFDELATFLKGLTSEDRTYFWTMVIQMHHFGFDPYMVAPFVAKAVAQFGITWKVVCELRQIIPFMNRNSTNVLYGSYHLVESLKDKLDIRPLAAGLEYSEKRRRLKEQNQTKKGSRLYLAHIQTHIKRWHICIHHVRPVLVRGCFWERDRAIFSYFLISLQTRSFRTDAHVCAFFERERREKRRVVTFVCVRKKMQWPQEESHLLLTSTGTSDVDALYRWTMDKTLWPASIVSPVLRGVRPENLERAASFFASRVPIMGGRFLKMPVVAVRRIDPSLKGLVPLRMEKLTIERNPAEKFLIDAILKHQDELDSTELEHPHFKSLSIF